MPLTDVQRSLVVILTALALTATVANAQAVPDPPSDIEAQLLAVLRSDAPAADKAIACKKLAIYGSSLAVDDLANLLPNPELSSWARIALEAIPGDESVAALREAIDSLEGELLVGVINSIGVRQDPLAVELLCSSLKNGDSEVASAAAVALGRIGNAAATDFLRGQLTIADEAVRSAVAEGCVLCAERLHAAGDASEAAQLYDEIRMANVPTQRRIEATRGAILARGQAGIPLLLEQFRSADKKMFQLALGTVREFPGGKVDQALADELTAAPADRAALIVQAMADRSETVVLAAVLQAAKQGPPQVRLSAISALGRVGDASCLPTLLAIATDVDADLADAAKKSLAELPSEKVDAQIVSLLQKAPGDSYGVLIELVGQRRIDAVPELLAALDHSDREIRTAALTALGETVGLERLPVLISAYVNPQHPEDAEVAQRALLAASVRMPDREACAGELSKAMERSPVGKQVVLLEILADVGGNKSLETLATSAKSSDTQLQDTASRLLGRWNSVDAAPVLLDLAKTAPEARFQIRALRGYLGLARKFAMPESQRAEMCQVAIDAANRSAEKELALEVLQLHPSNEGLMLAIATMKDSELKEQATRAALVIAQKLGGNADVSASLAKAGFERVKLEILNAEYGAGAKQLDVTELIKQVAGDLPFIALQAENYNAAFGGDPAPGVVKQLTIRYRINGKDAEATFAENELIVLPTPN